MKRCETVSCFGLQIGTLVQEEGHHVGLSPFGSHMEWGDVVLKLRTEIAVNNEESRLKIHTYIGRIIHI